MDAVILIPAFPLAGLVVNLLFGWRRGEKFAGWVATGAMALAFAASAAAFVRLLGLPDEPGARAIRAVLFEWIPAGGLGVRAALWLDPVSSLMTLVVTGVGTLIQGKSGIGKSECALHLVTRGHRLVADDVVDIQLRGHELVGRSTDLLKHHIEVRGLGILNLKDLFGVVAIRYEKNVDLIVELVPWSPNQPYERLGIDIQKKEVLGHSLPLFRIPVAPGRNIPTLIEVAARNLLLQRMGYFSAEEFSRDLAAQIAASTVEGRAESAAGGDDR